LRSGLSPCTMNAMAKLTFTTALALSAMLLLAACSPAKEKAGSAESPLLLPGDRPVAHPVHSSDLLAAMAELENLTLEELSANLPSDSVRGARVDEVERIANTLAASVATLPALLDSADLSKAEMARFRALADQLRRDVVSLRDRAASGDVDSAIEEREVLLETCNACHAEFRVMAPRHGNE